MKRLGYAFVCAAVLAVSVPTLASGGDRRGGGLPNGSLPVDCRAVAGIKLAYQLCLQLATPVGTVVATGTIDASSPDGTRAKLPFPAQYRIDVSGTWTNTGGQLARRGVRQHADRPPGRLGRARRELRRHPGRRGVRRLGRVQRRAHLQPHRRVRTLGRSGRVRRRGWDEDARLVCRQQRLPELHHHLRRVGERGAFSAWRRPVLSGSAAPRRRGSGCGQPIRSYSACGRAQRPCRPSSSGSPGLSWSTIVLWEGRTPRARPLLLAQDPSLREQSQIA